MGDLGPPPEACSGEHLRAIIIITTSVNGASTKSRHWIIFILSSQYPILSLSPLLQMGK